MTDHPVRSRRLTPPVARPQSRNLAAVAGALFIALAAGGCAEHKRATLPWPTASVVHPRIPETPATEKNLSAEDAPELHLPAPVVNFPPAASVRPPRSRSVPPQPAPIEVTKPQSPVAAPQLSAEE